MNLLLFIKALRPHQWIKNLLLLFPPFFGGALLGPAVVDNILPAFFSFSCAASCSYIINDMLDIEADRNHVSKRNRAIASGAISKNTALIVALSLFIASICLSFYVSSAFWVYLIAYFTISLSYTFYFKHIVIADIFFISFGFIIRVLAGGEAFAISVSNWLFMAVFMVSLFLAAGKRLGEFVSLGDTAHVHRKSLANYNKAFLEGILWFSASTALVTYALYTIEEKSELFYTVPLAAFGLIRYIYIARGGKGDPTEVLLKDRQIMLTGLIWAASIAAVVYY